MLQDEIVFDQQLLIQKHQYETHPVIVLEAFTVPVMLTVIPNVIAIVLLQISAVPINPYRRR